MHMNKRSSRGHSILTVYVQRTHKGTGYSGKLNLVDLAGMESAGGQSLGVSSNTDRKNETRHINQSLSFLATVVARLRAAVATSLPGFTCSAGVAANKMFAKLCAGLHKPDQQTVLPAEAVPALLHPLPLDRIKAA